MRKGKHGQPKDVLHRQELNIQDVTIFSYNFHLTKARTLYKKTVERITIRLQDYLKFKEVDQDLHDRSDATEVITSSADDDN